MQLKTLEHEALPPAWDADRKRESHATCTADQYESKSATARASRRACSAGARRCVQWNFLVVKPAPRATGPHGGSAGQDKIAKLLADDRHHVFEAGTAAEDHARGSCIERLRLHHGAAQWRTPIPQTHVMETAGRAWALHTFGVISVLRAATASAGFDCTAAYRRHSHCAGAQWRTPIPQTCAMHKKRDSF